MHQRGPKPFHVLIENTWTGRNVYFVEATDDKPSFETALTQLETIVEAMESGDVPLAELLAKFEEGNKLLKVCESRLKDAELKIELLKKQKEGVAFTKFETTGDV
jgi:exodeoxyribonuclease VII small subunit